jgi:hypothetical protein
MATPHTGYIEVEGKGARLYLVTRNRIVRRGWTTNKLKNKREMENFRKRGVKIVRSY